MFVVKVHSSILSISRISSKRRWEICHSLMSCELIYLGVLMKNYMKGDSAQMGRITIISKVSFQKEFRLAVSTERYKQENKILILQ